VDAHEVAKVVREFRLMLRCYFDLAREDWSADVVSPGG